MSRDIISTSLKLVLKTAHGVLMDFTSGDPTSGCLFSHLYIFFKYTYLWRIFRKLERSTPFSLYLIEFQSNQKSKSGAVTGVTQKNVRFSYLYSSYPRQSWRPLKRREWWCHCEGGSRHVLRSTHGRSCARGRHGLRRLRVPAWHSGGGAGRRTETWQSSDCWAAWDLRVWWHHSVPDHLTGFAISAIAMLN